MSTEDPTARCPGCQHGEAGSSAFTDAVEHRGHIETPMGCGCGGYVAHSVLRCGVCGRSFLTAYEEHWPPASEDYFILEIDRAEAEGILARWKDCPDVDNRDCRCPVHRDSESLHWPGRTGGTRRYFEATPQSWE